MQKSQVISAPVIAIDTGEALGKVINVLLDPEQLVVTDLIFGEGKWFPHQPSYMINLFDIQTIGPYAITIPHANVIMQTHKSEFDESLQLRAPEDKQVISDQGELLGVCRDYDFDFPSGELTGLIISDQTRKSNDFTIPGNQIVTLGNDYIIISYHQVHPPEHYPMETHYAAKEYNYSYEPEELLGKVVTQTIQDGYGNILICEGNIITPELLELAINHNVVNTLAVVADVDGDGATVYDYGTRFTREHSANPSYYYNTIDDWRKQSETGNGMGYTPGETEEWQTRLKYILNQAGSDMEEKLKSFLISKKPAYTVYSQTGEILKEKGQPIQVRDIERIQDKNDLLRLTASITASELNEFMSFIEGKVQQLINKGDSR